jgi:hypothetical protein
MGNNRGFGGNIAKATSRPWRLEKRGGGRAEEWNGLRPWIEKVSVEVGS